MKLSGRASLLILGSGLVLAVPLALYWGEPPAWLVADLRLPRLILTLLTGGCLALVGGIYQLIWQNPLADPYLLGISSGAALGGAIAALLGWYNLMPLLAFMGAMLASLLVRTLSGGFADRLRLVLSGVAAGMVFSAILYLLLFWRQSEAFTILGILMGDLGHIFSHGEWLLFISCAVLAALICIYLVLRGRSWEILGMGDETAASLGYDPATLRLEAFALTAILVGLVTSFAGMIGFVGLIIPHMTRLMVKGGGRGMLAVSFAGGALFLLLCDLVARHLTAIPLPVGVITALTGGPFFLYLLQRR